jgi:hypothetical protein
MRKRYEKLKGYAEGDSEYDNSEKEEYEETKERLAESRKEQGILQRLLYELSRGTISLTKIGEIADEIEEKFEDDNAFLFNTANAVRTLGTERKNAEIYGENLKTAQGEFVKAYGEYEAEVNRLNAVLLDAIITSPDEYLTMQGRREFRLPLSLPDLSVDSGEFATAIADFIDANADKYNAMVSKLVLSGRPECILSWFAPLKLEMAREYAKVDVAKVENVIKKAEDLIKEYDDVTAYLKTEA